jgi:hypothetical protein
MRLQAPASPLDAFLEVIHQEEHEPFKLIFSAAPGTLDGVRVYAVDVVLGNIVKSRGTTSRKGLDDGSAIELLRSRALGWIAEYSERQHAGDTGPGDL